MERQLYLDGVFAESEIKAELRVNQLADLETALRNVGLRPKLIAWRLAILIHTVATGDGVLRWNTDRIATDRYIDCSPRSVYWARKKLAKLGIIATHNIKRPDGGGDLIAMELDRRSIQALKHMSGHVTDTTTPESAPQTHQQQCSKHVQNDTLKSKLHPEIHPEMHPEMHPEISQRLYRSIEPSIHVDQPATETLRDSATPRASQPSTLTTKTATTTIDDVVNEINQTKGPDVLERRCHQLYNVVKHSPANIPKKMILHAAALDLATDWNARDALREIASGRALRPTPYLKACIENAIAKHLPASITGVN